MDRTDENRDDQASRHADHTQAQNTDRITTTTSITEKQESAPDYAGAIHPNPQMNVSLDSGISTSYQPQEGGADAPVAGSSNTQPVEQALIAEEQELTPDVRRILKRRRHRRRGYVSDRYDF